MARTGSFGVAPRNAPSLTSTLVAIAREFQQQRDENLMNAWQKGGTFEGGKATDEMVLKYWKERMEGVSKDDPLFDTYKNAHSQLDYTIHESKMTAAYALGKKSDGQMAHFYLGWAKKVPKNSEFYRVLQRDAGQYMRSARANADTLRRQAEEDRYQRQQNDTQQSHEAAGEYAIDTLRRIAQSGYADAGYAALIGAPGSGSDLTDFDPTDPEMMQKLMAVIAPRTPTVGEVHMGQEATGAAVGNTDVIYHEDDGTPVTGADIIAKFQKLDPQWKPGTPIDVTYVTGLLQRQMDGLQERIDRARKTGHETDADNLTKSKAYVGTLAREVAAYPVEQAYREARATFDAVANDASASPQALLKAWKQYQSELYGMSQDPRIAADDNMRSRLIAEANGNEGTPSLNESFTGLQQGAYDPQSAKDISIQQFNIKSAQAQVDAVTNGQAVWTYGTSDSNGNFNPSPDGKEIGAATLDQISGASMTTATIPDPRGTGAITVAVQALPVYGKMTNPDGTPMLNKDHNPLAMVYMLNGKRMYSFTAEDGTPTISEKPPWKDDLSVTPSSDGGNHFEVNFGQYDGQSAAPGVEVKNNARGQTHTFVFDYHTAGKDTDERHGTAQADPHTDFRSLTLAYLTGSPDGATILNNLDKYPVFRDQITSDINTYAGMTRDMKTGQWVPGANFDQKKLDDATAQFNITQRKSPLDPSFNDEMRTLWQREYTTPATQAEKAQDAVDRTSTFFQQTASTLPSDALRGTQWAAFANAFKPGTSQLMGPPNPFTNQLTIKPATALVVPQLPSVGFKMKTEEMGSVAPTQTTTQVYGPPAPSQTQYSSAPPTGTGGGGGARRK